MNKKLGIYVHFPFCKSKCAYCDFYSVADGSYYSKYTAALIKQIDTFAPVFSAKGIKSFGRPQKDSYTVDTVYFGGGTPSILPTEYLIRITNALKDSFTFSDKLEFTIEANPGTLTEENLKTYLSLGINRLSLGLQSAHDGELKILSRIHSADDFVKSYNLARKVGFENVSIDIMYGLPNQTYSSLFETLDFAVNKIKPEHISMYGLKIEENTHFGKIKDSLLLPCEDTECKMYLDAVDFFSSNGYYQYEISNFARKGFESKHNLKYWNLDEYMGFGPGAHSFTLGKRFSFPRDIKKFIENSAVLSPHVFDSFEEISDKECETEYVMLSLRLNRGIVYSEYKAKFGLDFNSKYGEYTDKYANLGLMHVDSTGCRFTAQGMLLSNSVLSDMLSF